ncbi:autotransporter domain-containing protein [Methylobacterium trifolii]|nr:autotransporter domain-containing protein [Methylobacterium trifolii]
MIRASRAHSGSGGSARRVLLRSGTAMLLVMTASAVHAQCVTPPNGSGVVGGLPATFGLPINSTVSGVQSLVAVLTTQNTAFLTQTSGFIGAPANPAPGQQGGGVWVRGVGGTFDTSTPGAYLRDASPTTPVAAGGSCNVRTYQDYSGFQTGADIARLNIDGANIHGGVTMGYTESAVRSNGTFRADFQTPFVGIYAAITKGGFFADGQVRWDFYQGLLNDPNNTLSNQRLDARSLSITGNVGQQFPLADGWFVEPSAGAVYSEVKVDTLQTGGALFLLNSPSFAAPTSVKVQDFDSILARASLRVGKNVIVGGYALQPFFTASVINEFGGAVRSILQTGVDPVLGTGTGSAPGFYTPLEQSGRLSTYRIGTYGQFSAGIAGQVLNTGWLGYVRGDYRTGERVEGWGISGGLRYQFNPEGAPRALISKDGAPSFVPSLDGPMVWSGFSLGGSVGGLWSQTRQTQAAFFLDDVQTVNPHAAGVYAGGQIGADYQFGSLVVGIAGDAGWTNARGGRSCGTGGGGFVYSCETNTDSLYMATARIGYALDRTLFYAKGGAAFADTSERQRNNFNSQPLYILTTGQFPNSAVSTFSTGWTVGAGFEFAITKNWTAKAEYMHYELDAKRYANFPSQANQAFLSSQNTGDLVKVGVNYRFTLDVPPPVAPARAVIAKY